MLYKRSAAVAAAFVAAVASPAFTAASASALVAIPWTEQTVFALGPTDNYVAEWMGLSQGWTIIGGTASEIYAGSAGVFATNPSTGDIYEYNGTPGSWTEIGGPGAQFAEGGGHLYGLGPDYSYVAEWNGPAQGWAIIGGPPRTSTPVPTDSSTRHPTAPTGTSATTTEPRTAGATWAGRRASPR